MRILLVPNSYLPQIGGLEIAVANLAQELVTRGHVVVVATTSPNLRFSKARDSGGIIVYQLPFALPRIVFRAGMRKLGRSVVRSLLSPLLMPLCLRPLVQIMKRERPDVVNLHYIGENALFVLLSRRFAHFKLVVNVHGDDIERYADRSRVARWLARETLARADRVLANSAHILARAVRALPEVSGKSAIVGNGVDLERFAPEEAYDHCNPYVLSIGNFGHKKGFDILLQAFARVHREHPAVDLIMAGDGHERGRCQRLAAQLGLGNAVIFLGRVDHSEVPALLYGCEVFVLPSRREPFGIVVLEAMAAGKPVVATRVGGVPEIIDSEKDGLLVKPESPEALAEGINLLLRRPSMGEELGRNGRQTVMHRFTWAKVCDRFESSYRAAIEARAP